MMAYRREVEDTKCAVFQTVKAGAAVERFPTAVEGRE